MSLRLAYSCRWDWIGLFSFYNRSSFISSLGGAVASTPLDVVRVSTWVQCSLQFGVKLVDIADCKMRIRKIGLINLIVILVIFLPLFVHKYMLLYILQLRKIQKNINIIIHKKINLNDILLYVGLQRWKLVSVAKLVYHKIGGSTVHQNYQLYVPILVLASFAISFLELLFF